MLGTLPLLSAGRSSCLILLGGWMSLGLAAVLLTVPPTTC